MLDSSEERKGITMGYNVDEGYLLENRNSYTDKD
jgi:hypothetical protein